MTIKDCASSDRTRENEVDKRECREIAARLLALQRAKTAYQDAADSDGKDPYWRMEAARLIRLPRIELRTTKGKRQ